MEDNETLQITIDTFKNSSKRNLENTLFYIKKLIGSSTNEGGKIQLQPSESATTFIVSLHETFDWNINEGNYCQIVCLTLKSEIIADVILWFDHLWSLIADPNQYKEVQWASSISISLLLEGEYNFEFRFQRIGNSKSFNFLKKASPQIIQGHLMKLKQFNHPVHCALCDRFLWGLYYQGFQCFHCALVTHKKCCHDISFWCKKSMFPEPPSIDPPWTNDNSHTFESYEAVFAIALITGNHSHCNHCGSQIFRNALQCTKSCRKSNDPPPSISSIEPPILIKDQSPLSIPSKPTQLSTTSSTNFSTFDPLPGFTLENQRRISLPKFSDFEYVGRLGSGGYAQVYCVQHILSKQYFAIKVADGTNEQARQQLEVEKQILFRYSYGNSYMVKAYCAFHQGSNLFLVMELVQGGTLFHKIQTKRMNEDEIRFYVAQLICVLQYLHSKNIVYRDLKLEHAIVNSTGSIRLIDYGLGRLLKTSGDTCHTFCGTYSYMAPEVRRLKTGTLNDGYSYPIDFWALGVMFIEMLHSKQIDVHSQIFENNDEETNEPESVAQILQLPSHTSAEARACVSGLLENDPEKRLGSPNSPHGSIREHPFFKIGHQINWQEIEFDSFKPVDHVSTVSKKK
ncbi:unnamed protein product [Rotaria magnacalcarata]|uniref:protein kinase C n=1 Tax=Rotaria magnacalcarata TaxID=392030 RepID=A0A816EYQ5_9BILA|nr:unnamed protein product [Rotaria magnacalcarata]CAF2261596.1 unnamed protein product [Rotaria magnacalcarata]